MLQQIASLVWDRTSCSNKVPKIHATGLGKICYGCFHIIHVFCYFVYTYAFCLFCGGITRVQR